MTLALTVVVIAIAFAGFYWFGVPSYRLTEQNLAALLEQTLAGSATASDWEVLAGFMIHHDEQLEQQRLRLVAIAEREMIADSNPVRLTAAGERELRQQLQLLRHSTTS